MLRIYSNVETVSIFMNVFGKSSLLRDWILLICAWKLKIRAIYTAKSNRFRSITAAEEVVVVVVVNRPIQNPEKTTPS